MKATGADNSEEIVSYKSVAYESPGSKYVVPVGSFHVKAIFLLFFTVLPVAVSMFGSGYLENCQIHLPKQVQTVYAAQTSAPTTTTKKPSSGNFFGRRRRSADDDGEEVLSSINLCESVWLPVFGFYLLALLIRVGPRMFIDFEQA
ncbi:Oidioi.mRNA.OKI2018_I69.PAR.g11844.t1.cds [Oikopleura dioica]|uniref:Oidioi.mRNA.OKI2018_I69.PAR.g11844.t1.cds n=1 Tax=Oikopleura dioica TaxID=34765 RepID=A0ABN7S0M5_OIKDI|nr:Oidioi.mRNA.OKI2018_I69.PAR.g11844.t1.cds [Oikopleura dioica]